MFVAPVTEKPTGRRVFLLRKNRDGRSMNKWRMTIMKVFHEGSRGHPRDQAFSVLDLLGGLD